MSSADVAVLGAGPAGLAAAWLAARQGHRVVVLERAQTPGGMAASFEVAGLRVDHGSHRLHPTTDPVVLDALTHLLGDGELQWRRRHGRIRLAGRWVRFPLKPADVARRLPPSFLLGGAADAVTAPLRRPTADTFAAVVRAGLGPTMGERFYFPYARKLWGAEPDELSGEHARRRIALSSPLALAARVLRGSGQRGQGGWFWYPRRGFGAIVEALADAAVGAGAELRLGTEVREVRLGEGSARVVAAERAAERAGERAADVGVTVDARHVWSTLPVPALARLADPAPPPAVVEAAGALPHRAMVLVYLAVERRQWTVFDAHYLPGPETPVTRVSEPRNYRDGPDPDDRTVLCAEIPCRRGDDIWTAAAGALGERVAADLAALGLPPVTPSAVEVRRLPAAYPVYRVGFEPHLAALEAWAERQRGLVTLGRHGLHAHDNTHHALATAWAAAAALRPDGSFDDAAWAHARAGFRTHVVED